MTLSELRQRVYVQLSSSHGHYRVEIQYRWKTYYCITTNSMAYDAVKSDNPVGYTEKQALKSLYEECKRSNKLR